MAQDGVGLSRILGVRSQDIDSYNVISLRRLSSCRECVCVCKLLVTCSMKKRYLFHIIKQGRAAPVAYCTQQSYCHWWEGEADHFPVPAKNQFELVNKLSSFLVLHIFV